MAINNGRNSYYDHPNFISPSFFFRDDVINIFCDASTTAGKNQNVDVCSGFISISKEQIIDEYYHCINGTNSSFGELDALRLAISYGISAAKLYRRVNIFSDYQAGVFGIRNWIGRWRLLNGNIVGSKVIQNQQIYLEIAMMLIDSQVANIAIYHQKGHVEMNCRDKTLNKAKNLFSISNGIPKEYTDDEFIRYISNWNSYVDKATRKILMDTDLSTIRYVEPLEFSSMNFNEIQVMVAPILDKIKQNMYLS